MKIEEFVTVIRTRVDRSVDQGRRALDDLADGAQRVALGMGAVVAATAAATLAVAREADRVAKGAQRLRLASDEYQALEHVAGNAGTSIESLGRASRALALAQDAARQGSGAQAQAFARIGVSATDASGNLRSFADLLPDLIDGLAGLASEEERTAIGSVLLGRGYTELIPLVNAGGAAFRQAEADARALGYTFDAETLRSAQSLNDTLSDLGFSLRGLLSRALAPMIPVLEDAATAFRSWWLEVKPSVDAAIDRYFGGLAQRFRELSPALKGLTAGAAIASILGLGRALIGLGSPAVAAALGRFATASLPVLALTAAVAALAAGLDDLRGFLAGEDSITEDLVRSLGGEEAVQPVRESLQGLISLVENAAGALSTLAGAAAATTRAKLGGWLRDVADAVRGWEGLASAIERVASELERLPTLAGAAEGFAARVKGSAEGWRQLGEVAATDSDVAGRALFGAASEVVGPALRAVAEGGAGPFGAAVAGLIRQSITVNAPGATPAEAARIARELQREQESELLGAVGLPASLVP